MAKKQRNRAQTVSSESNDLSLNTRRTAVSLAVAAALSGAPLMSNVAHAQDDQVIEEIVTIGVRMSILDSVATKRDSDVVSDVVDAGALGMRCRTSQSPIHWAAYLASARFVIPASPHS